MADDWLNWEDLDPEVDAFTKVDMLIPYKGGWSAQFGRNLARNTSWNWRHSGQILYFDNEYFTAQQERDYDTDRDYEGNPIMIWILADSSPHAYPFRVPVIDLINAPNLLKLSTSYQLCAGLVIEIKALASGGFRIKNDAASDSYYLIGWMDECRLVLGTPVP